VKYRPSHCSQDQSDRSQVIRAHALLCAAEDLLRTAYAELKTMGIAHAALRQAWDITEKTADEIADCCWSDPCPAAAEPAPAAPTGETGAGPTG
jgi:hypothetical protein